MLHIHPGSIQGSLYNKEQSDLSIPEYWSRFVLCCFGITVNWSLLIRQQDLDTVIITTIFPGSICLHEWLVRVPESLLASSPFMIQASCKTTRERAAKPRERSGGFLRLWHSRLLSRAVLAWLLATPRNGELAYWLSSGRWLISVRRVSGLFILQLITKFPAINVIKFSWRGSTPGFDCFNEIGHIFHDKFIFHNKNTFQVEIWPIS